MDYGQAISTVSSYLVAFNLALGAYLLYGYYFNKSKVSWEKYGIVHAKIVATQFVDFRSGFSKLIKDYGDKVGFSRGDKLQLVTTDLDLIRKVMITDFNNFVNRAEHFVTKSHLLKSVFFSENMEWKRKRQILSPSFSTAKLKILAKIVEKKATRLSQFMVESAENHRLVPIKAVAGYFTGEIIAQAAFGCQVDCYGNGENDEFTMYCERIFRERSKWQQTIVALTRGKRWLQTLMINVLGMTFVDPVDVSANKYFNSLLQEVIIERVKDKKEGKKVPMDFLQMLINGSSLDGSGDTDIDGLQKLNYEDIVAEMMLVIFAGFLTTATTIQFSMYFLAAHQDIQEKVFQEITDKVQGETPTYEELSQLTYTKQVIDETLRLYPPAPLVERTASADRCYGDFTIPANTRVTIPMFVIHRDPENYPDPERFDPDRFTSDEESRRHPFAFCPFGAGPRQCLGIRLAYLEMKQALVHSLRKVKVMLNDETTPRPGEGFKLGRAGVAAPENAIMLAVEPRGQ